MKLNKITIIAAASAIDIILWVGLIVLVANSGLPLYKMMALAAAGGATILVLIGILYEFITQKPKKRHATLKG